MEQNSDLIAKKSTSNYVYVYIYVKIYVKIYDIDKMMYCTYSTCMWILSHHDLCCGGQNTYMYVYVYI